MTRNQQTSAAPQAAPTIHERLAHVRPGSQTEMYLAAIYDLLKGGLPVPPGQVELREPGITEGEDIVAAVKPVEPEPPARHRDAKRAQQKSE